MAAAREGTSLDRSTEMTFSQLPSTINKDLALKGVSNEVSLDDAPAADKLKRNPSRSTSFSRLKEIAEDDDSGGLRRFSAPADDRDSPNSEDDEKPTSFSAHSNHRRIETKFILALESSGWDQRSIDLAIHYLRALEEQVIAVIPISL